MTLSLSDALQLQNDKGEKINFQLVNNPLNGELPKYYCGDIEEKMIYSLSILPPYDLVTVRVTNMTEQQKQQGKQQQVQQKKSKK